MSGSYAKQTSVPPPSPIFGKQEIKLKKERNIPNISTKIFKKYSSSVLNTPGEAEKLAVNSLETSLELHLLAASI
jgi:hypothetical protein